MIAGIIQLDRFAAFGTGSHPHCAPGFETFDFGAVVVCLQLWRLGCAFVSAPRVSTDDVGASDTIRLCAVCTFCDGSPSLVDVFVGRDGQEFSAFLIGAVPTEHHVSLVLFGLCFVCLDELFIFDDVLKVNHVEGTDVLAAAWWVI